MLANLKTGVRTIVHTPMLRNLFLLGAPVFFSFGLWNVLLLPMAIKVLGATEFEYGLQEGLTSVGYVAGALFMARYSDRLPMGNWLMVGYLGMGIGGIFYALSPTIAVAILWVIVTGFFNSPSSVGRQTLLQRNTPRELRGRVFSGLYVMRDVIFLAGMAGAGLADIIDVRVMLVFSSLILIATGIASAFTPGIGRPAAEWRRGLSALRAKPVPTTATARLATVSDFDRLVGRLATFSLLSDTQRAAFINDARVRDVPEGERVVSKGDEATCAYFILDGEAAAGIPEAEGGYRGLSTMGAGDFFGEIAALTGSARTADVVVTRPTTLHGGARRDAACRHGGPRGRLAGDVDAHRAPPADEPDGPAAPRDDGPVGAPRAQEEGARDRGAAGGRRRRGLSERLEVRGRQPRGTGRIG